VQQIIYFFIRNKKFLLAGLLFFIALILTIRSHSYHNAKFISSANFFSGGIYSLKSDVTDYFGLEAENLRLLEENSRLRAQIENLKTEVPISTAGLGLDSQYTFIPARVINNNYSRTKNNITIKAGTEQGIEKDHGVITSKGIIGIINGVSSNYATVQSILNSNSQINAKLKKSEHFGFLQWHGGDPNVAQLVQIPRLTPIQKGDTIVTGGRSTIFPKGILIGTIEDYTLGSDDSYIINVALFNDMTSLKHVYVIENQDTEEIIALEKEIENAKQ
jgi:rod shape-determining protein MreC